MIDKKREMYCFYHGYAAALTDVLQQWNKGVSTKDISDFRLTTMLQSVTADLKKLKEGKDKNNNKGNTKRDKNGYEE